MDSTPENPALNQMEREQLNLFRLAASQAAYLLGAISATVVLDLKTKRAVAKWLREFGRGK